MSAFRPMGLDRPHAFVASLLFACSLVATTSCSEGTELLGTEDGLISADFVSADVPDAPTPDGTSLPDNVTPPDATHTEVVGVDAEQDVDIPESPMDCPGNTWCPCSDNTDCFSGWCVEGPNGMECTKTCEEDCPAGYTCRKVSNANGDPTYLCLYDHVYYCSPCESGADCSPPLVDVSPHYCVPGAEGEGSFCATSCEESADCPPGGTCVEVAVGDEIRTLCQPNQGECACSANAIAVNAKTSCYEENEHGICDGERLCELSGLTACDAAVPAAEVCNGLDEDCDGLVDESFAELGTGCDSEADADACEDGTWECANGILQCNDVEDESGVKAETCNGADDDCDGTVDEAFDEMGLPCDGEDLDLCLDGAWICNNGAVACDDDGASSEETCNNQDDDCDGAIDETFLTKGTPCDGPDGDACSTGKWVCSGDGLLVCDEPAGNGISEVCNDVDDDCDGTVDEGFPEKGTLCDGVDGDLCAEGTWQCNGTSLSCSDDTGDSVEVCNDLDDNCDGIVDEGFTSKGFECDGADADFCAEGTWQCNGVDLVCSDTTPDSVELCNNQDDDCDGIADEGYELKGAACDGIDADLCLEGTWTCDGSSLVCSDTTGPNTETCNNQDDDCDGSVDENLQQVCSTACGQGVETCSAGSWSSCTAMEPKSCTNYDTCGTEDMCVTQCPSQPAEVCNKIDDDCDGATDEGYYGDTSNFGSDFPDSWSISIPEKGEYPGLSAGTVYGHLLGMGDHDWFTVKATENKNDFCITDGQDANMVAQVTITSPGVGLWYEVCACWSDGPALCGKDDEGEKTCATSINGNTAVLEVTMDMNCGGSDVGWLDIEVLPSVDSLDWDCADYTVTWAISE